MSRHKLVDGVKVNLTPAEEAERDSQEQAWLAKNSPFDIAMRSLRRDRNNKLAETDFYALSDVTMSPEMETYRQELRDITEGLTTVEDVEAVVFPTKP
jgi:hypothetical protein|tara:strand:- start:294 stop:587 length:294 start_codon:yes stop_codon:yes gene_type:complete